MMPSFWSMFIVVLLVANVAVCLWMLMGGRDISETETTGHVWDGDLKEYNNPLPRWWLYLFWGTAIYSAIYLILFPGLGNFSGTLGWTQEGQYAQEVERAEATYGEIFKRLAATPIPELAKDPAGQRAGRNIFVNNCATCHGSDGRGARGYPNLTDDVWLYGGDAKTVVQSIANGRYGVMAPYAAILTEQQIAEVTEYTLSLSGREGLDGALVTAGQQHYMIYCVACHGAEGKGMQALGAADLTDDVWLHGSSRARIKTVIAEGLNNQMPAQADFLTPERIHVVAAYVLSLGAAGGE